MKPTKPELWKKITKQARASSLGSPKGRWSPRKAAASRREYEKQGGKWQESKPPKK
jgi:hypothetical protein